ncbi:MAG: hypothetical protein M1840_007735 [Geoglossum simile]|nr:MAG: hypothetical protein M1840_007735 [Geoglossum simile]
MAELLLEECEHLTHNTRVQRMIQLGRSAGAGDANAQETITLLSQGNLYERLLAIQTCYTSSDFKPALTSLSHPSFILRRRALRVITALGSDAQTHQALILTRESGLQKEWVATLRRLRCQERYAVIDPLVESEATRGVGTRLRAVLPFASEGLVRKLLSKCVDTLDPVDWRRLATFCPRVACEGLQDWAMSSEVPGHQLLQVVNVLLPTLADNITLPRLAIDLVKAMRKLAPLARLDLYKVIQRHPQEIAAILLAGSGEEPGNIKFTNVAHQLETKQLLALFERYPRTIDRTCLEKLAPDQRVLVCELCHGWRSPEGVLLPNIIKLLPRSQRVREAQRAAGHPAIQARPLERLRYAEFLDWEDAIKMLETPLRSSDACIRGLALRGIIGAARYQHEHLVDALQWALRARNEQDPVRREMLDALEAIPPSYWQEAQLPSLAQVIRHALDASDLSVVGAWSLLHLLKRLLLFYPSWSAAQVALIYREREDAVENSPINQLSPSAAQHLAVELYPLIELWQKRGNVSLLVALASSFGQQLHIFRKLIDALEEILLDLSTSLGTRLVEEHNSIASTGQMILSTIQSYMPERVDVIVPRLLQRGQGLFRVYIIYEHLSSHRQDLLSPFLTSQRDEGNDVSPFNMPALLEMEHSGFQRWTATQQSLLAQTLVKYAQRADTPINDVSGALRQLSALSFLGDGAPGALIPFASEQRAPVRYEALRALGRLDDVRQAIPTLLEALYDDDRARIAIHALRPALKRIGTSKAAKLLYAIPQSKVTVAKEVVRLVGELESEEAYRYLIDMEKSCELHRDVRIALVGVLYSLYVNNPESWDAFRRAAQDPSPDIANSVIQIPTVGLSNSLQRKLLELIAQLLESENPTLRHNALLRCIESPIPDPGRLLVARLVELTQSPLPDEMSAAIKVILITYSQDQPTLIADTIARLQGSEKRKPLYIFISTFVQEAISDRKRYLETTRAILDVLGQDRLTLSLRLKLILSALPWPDARTSLLTLCSTPSITQLHPDALVAAEYLIQQMFWRSDVHLAELELAMADSPHEATRRLALSALVAQSHQAGGWTGELRARLKLFQQDASTLVAEAAQFIFPAED